MQIRNLVAAGACACAITTAAVVAPASAQSVLAYPLKGQSADQMHQDESECRIWAMERTGFNPRQGPPRVYSQQSYSSYDSGRGFGSGETGQGGVVRDGARGAAIGAIGGAIAGDAGKGAAWGALGGAIFGGARRNQRRQQEADWHRQQQQQQQAQQQQMQMEYEQARSNYNGAIGLCMESRNYRVQY